MLPAAKIAGSGLVIGRDAQKDDVLILKFLLDLNQIRREAPARWSPIGPDIENHHLSFELFPIGRGAIAPALGP